MVLGGKAHIGWLPDGAGTPLPTPRREVTVDFLIEGDENGAMLYWQGNDGTKYDYWCESVDGAISQAEFSWGVLPKEWSAE